MYVIEHALLNLGKNKGRNILLGIILFAVITSAFIGMAIYNTSASIVEDTKAELEILTPKTPQGGNRITAGERRSEEQLEAELTLKQMRSFANSIESLNSLALTFLLIVLVFGAAIVILLSVIAIRERKYEIGVLRAMGMKKGKVALCLWVEILCVACVCFALGMLAGISLSQPVSNALWTGEGTVSIALDVITVLEIFGVTVLLASIAGTVSVSRITKYEPIKILMERD